MLQTHLSLVFSVMSEGTDKISQNSLEDLNHNLSGGSNADAESIKQLLSSLPSFGDKQSKVQEAEQMKENAYHFDPDQYTSKDTQAQIWQALCWRDSLMRDIEEVILGVPGLEKLVEQLSQSLTVCQFFSACASIITSHFHRRLQYHSALYHG